MIAIETLDGDLVKVFNQTGDFNLGLHKLFGFISEEKASKRLQTRKLQGFEFNKNEWLCKLKLNISDNKISVKENSNCEFVSINKTKWKLTTASGEFYVVDKTASTFAQPIGSEHDSSAWFNKFTEVVLFGIFLIIPIIYLLQPSAVEETEEKKKEIKPVTVQVIQQVKAVNVSKKNPSIKVKPLTKSQRAKRAVQRNLGFLGLVGSKDLSKVVGGVPQKLNKATAGAGAGGDAGSGGEVLTGLGKGLKKTTVGNTGVAGLGGVGTKGAGGGAGGYGNTMVASGEGKGISAISVASNDMVLDGGLSRYAINATIAKYLSQVRRCYESQLNKQPGLEGLVTVSFQISGNGMLNYSRVKNSSLKSAVVEKCITTKMMGWKFPTPKGGVNVNINYPFMLRPVGK